MAHNAKATRTLQEQMSQNLQAMVDVQKAVGWIEVFFASVYLAELWHLFASEIDSPHYWIPYGVVTFAVVGFSSAAAILKPWKHAKKSSSH
jgi:hypothetical protein